ncbi:transcription initiation factor TFIID subunit 7 [Planococcus citri]|uniref:transcription initiation factor TFIID subunit 7 n=1 Tax=Planococcus citri TaxID=170843 RepID=UPI0031F788FE
MAKNDKIVDQYTELESQFILRLPPEPAKVLREALRSGASLKDRFSIKLENDVRKAEVKFDHWYFFARVVDLPCIIESLKTIDSKSTYKTADICQMMICKEDEDPIQSDEEDKTKQKKKDNVKVDKKYLWPHGITPPMKNVRRRRFRKTLRKKYVEAPEIEKEIKRLLRGDSDAVNVKWEVINEQDEKSKAMGVTVKEEPLAQGIAHNLHSEDNTNVDVAEHDLFGEALSDSEDEETNNNLLALDEDNSRLSCEDSSRLSDSVSLQSHSTGRNPLVTEFRKEMFSQHNDFVVQMPNIKSEIVYEFEQPSSVSSNPEFSIKSEASNSYDFEVGKNDDPNKFTTEYIPESSSGDIRARMEQLEMELAELKTRRNNQETEIANIENLALRQRFQHKLDNLLAEQMEKEQQYQELVAILDQQ